MLKTTATSLDPNLFARELADIAIGCGCPLDVSVIVVKLNMDIARVGLEDEGQGLRGSQPQVGIMILFSERAWPTKASSTRRKRKS